MLEIGHPSVARYSSYRITLIMTYRGHQKAITSLLAALGLGGAGYGTHKYIKYNRNHTNSLATRYQNGSSTVSVPRFIATPHSNTYTTDPNPSPTEVLIEVESLPSVPPNTAFRKQGFGGSLLRSSIIVGLASIFFPAVRNVSALGWVLCGLALLVTLYAVFQTEITKYLRNWPVPQHTIQMNIKTQTDEKYVEVASLQSDFDAAKSMIAAIHQALDPESTSPKTNVLDLVRNLERSRKLNDKQHRDKASRIEKDLVKVKANHEQFENRIRMLEETNRSLESDLKQSEDEIGRLIEQREADKANYKRKKEHYKAVAHHAANANNATKTTEQTTEDSLQKRLREVMADHNKNLATLQQDNDSLRSRLTIARQHQEGMAQKLAKFDQETVQQNMAIEAEVKRLRANENAQLLRTQKLEDASAERERRLRDQLEKVQNEKMTEVDRFEKKIRALREETKTLEDENNVALGDLQKHVQDLERKLDRATHESNSTAKTENEALKTSVSAALQKETALAKSNSELQNRLQKLETELTRKLEDKETQLQQEKLKHDKLRDWVKSKVKKPVQANTTKHLAIENNEFNQRSPASGTASQDARPQEEQAHNKGSHPQNMDVLGSVEPQRTTAQTDFTVTRPEQEDVPALQKETHSPTHTPDSLADTPLANTGRSPVDQPTGSQSQDVQSVDDPASHIQQERPVKLKAQADESRRETAGSSLSTTKDPAINMTNPLRKQKIFNKLTTSIPGLFPTAPQADSADSADSAENLPAPKSSDPTEPPPILLNFDPVEFTASVPPVPQPSTPTAQSPHSTDPYQFTSTLPAEPRYFETLSNGRRSTEAEISTRRKIQPRRRNQTINNSHQITPRSQSTSSTLQFDPQALLAAMTPPAAAATQPDALALYDQGNALAKVCHWVDDRHYSLALTILQLFTEQAGATIGAKSPNAPPVRPNIFEGKMFDKCAVPSSRIC